MGGQRFFGGRVRPRASPPRRAVPDARGGGGGGPPYDATVTRWRVAGRYFEACSCEAVCPCRRVGARPGGRSTYGVCDFALGWSIDEGHAEGVDLAGLQVVMAGSYDDDETGSPWRVALYIDDRASDQQREALERIFLGRSGGSTLSNFAAFIGDVLAVRSARISIDHAAGGRRITAGEFVEVVERSPYVSDEPVSCGIPGHDQPGEEVIADVFAVREEGLRLEVRGRCGFASKYDYRSDG